MKKFSILIFSITLLLSCNTSSKKSTETISPEVSSENTTDGQMSNTQVTKFNAIVKCFNGFSSRANKAYETYTSKKGVDENSFVKGGAYLSSISEYNIKDLQSLKGAIENKSFAVLNPTLKTYQEQGLVLASNINEASNYYEMKDYEEDNSVKGKEMHKPLLTAFNNFYETENTLRNLTDSIQTKFETARLIRLKKEGKELDYNVGMTLINCRKLLNYAQSKDILALDIPTLKGLQAEVRKNYDFLNKFKTEKPEEFKKYSYHLSSFTSEIKSFILAAKNVQDRVKKKKKYSNMDIRWINQGNGWMVNGSAEKMLREFNEIVTAYNRMN